MFMVMFTNDQMEKMLECFGSDFLETLPEKLDTVAQKWQLDDLLFIEYYSVNCLFTCVSKHYGDCVLKVFGTSHEWYIDEIRALNESKGNLRYVQTYECDEELGALLLERIFPGVTLKAEPSIDKRLSEFVRVWKNAHIEPREPFLFKTYLESVEIAALKPWAIGEIPELRQAAKSMVAACRSLYEIYPERLLLHGDLHGDNLLSNLRGEYTIVDPHGRIGPPICDLGRYIANEYADAKVDEKASVIDYVTTQLSDVLGLPRDDVFQAFFVDITLMTCWDAEDGTADLAGVLLAQGMQ